MKTYCRECGSPAEHKGIKPKFCPNCGEKMPSFGNPKKVEPDSSAQKSDDYEDEEVESRPIDISKLDVEISVSSATLTVGDIVGTGGTGFSLERETPEMGKGKKAEFLEEFRKEAGGDPHRPR